MRTIVDIPDDIIQSLDALRNEESRSRASLIREAVRSYVAKKAIEQSKQEAFGLWKDSPIDGLKHQQALRDEWNDR